MSVLHITASNLDQIKSSEKPVLVDFFADWCGPCRMIAPIIEEIAAERKEIVVAKVNVDEEPELAQSFGVSAVPTLAVMKNGEIKSLSVGAKPKNEILKLLEN